MNDITQKTTIEEIAKKEYCDICKLVFHNKERHLITPKRSDGTLIICGNCHDNSDVWFAEVAKIELYNI